MTEIAAEARYLQMLEGVAERADRIGDRLIASHWPFVGSAYDGLLVVGHIGLAAPWDGGRVGRTT
jgi:hypothetical protein